MYDYDVLLLHRDRGGWVESSLIGAWERLPDAKMTCWHTGTKQTKYRHLLFSMSIGRDLRAILVHGARTAVSTNDLELDRRRREWTKATHCDECQQLLFVSEQQSRSVTI